ncbi:MAG: BMP family ABC transporter substrate-binding protein [Proteobacteria bacterium]|nr:BMP family ABC transporter substrate-binding protein [Pseudomonadota bacterium]
MKQPFFFAIAVLAVAVATAGCKKKETAGQDNSPAGSQTPDKPAAPSAAKSGIKIGLVYDVGGRGDKSFNDSAYRGLKWAETELGVTIREVEPGEGSEREAALRQLAAAGHDLVFGVGFLFTDDITKIARDFPKVKFACVDYTVPDDPSTIPSNLVGLRFREHEGSFLIGAIAGIITKVKTVGFVGGMKIPLIRKFEAGYQAGVKHVCPDCKILSAYAGTTGKAFNNPNKGQELALSQYEGGSDVIYHASGKTGDGVFNAAKEKKKWAIGVDSDQFHVAPCCVLTSMLKRVDVVVFDTIKATVAGEFRNGLQEFGLAEDGVGFVYDDNNKDRLSQDVVDRVNGLTKKIIAGEIKVPFE